MARWLEVYLNTNSITTPVTTATSVAESQPGSAAIGASKTLAQAFATAFNQTTSCVMAASFDIAQPAKLVGHLLLGLFDFQPLDLIFDRGGDEFVELL